ncbi:MAG: protease pro-enzyme activation domain-containing protein [Thaumarchaeota archaeon]|nr:protease pro-enzyme activation domain-containing protein [Nitrososphaerota archaeon]
MTSLLGQIPPPVTAGAAPFASTVPAILQLHMELTFEIRNAASFQQCLDAINNPSSPNYHDFLTNTTLEPYLPTPGERSSVVTYLEDNGLQVTNGSSPLTLQLTASAAVAEVVFGIKIDVFSQDGRTNFYAPATNPSMPESLAGLISSIGGLANYTSIARTESPCSGPYCPQGIQAGYSLTSLYGSGYNGAGESVAIADEPGDSNMQSAINTYDSQFGLPSTTLTILYPDGVPSGYDPGWASEAAMDVEAVHTTAPGAGIILLYGSSTSDDPLNLDDYVASHHLANVVSNSWTYDCGSPCSDTQLPSAEVSSDDSRLALDSSMGLTILFASGDSGAKPDGTDLGTEFPSSDPNVLAVGATNLNLAGCGVTTCTGYSSETGASISGGGYSGVFAEPAWQKAAIGTAPGRGVPDISMLGYSPGIWVYSTDSDKCGAGGDSAGWFDCSGTSLSTQLWAGIIGIILQARGGAALGNFAPALWQLASSASYSADFHDVTSGSNGGYSAGTGWDPVTGWGTPIASNLIASLASTVTQTITCTVANSGPTATMTLSGAGVNPTTLACDGTSHSFTADPSSAITVTAPTDGANTRYRFAGISTTTTVSTCASGTCPGASIIAYYQLQNTYQGDPQTPATWDAAFGIHVSGSQAGSLGQTGCTITTMNGGGIAGCQAWFDYNTGVTLASPMSVSGTEQWTQSGGNTFTQTTGGNTNNVNYLDQFAVTFAVSPSGAGTTNPSGTSVFETYGPLPISASPNGGFVFSSWSASSGGITLASAGSASTSATIHGAGTITATFVQQQGALSLDGSASGNTNLGTTVTVSLTTSCYPDVIIVLIGENTARATAGASAPTSSGLTFTQRSSLQSGTVRTWEYYSIATGKLVGQVISETMSQATAYTMTAFGVCGANTASPFDSNPSLPKANGGFIGTSHSNTATTSNSNDFIFGFDSSQGNPSYAPLNGYNSILTQDVPSWMASSSEYKVVSSAQSGTALGFTLSVGESGSQIVDAIVAGSPGTTVTQPITLTIDEAGGPVATFTINGCGASPTTIQGDGASHVVTMQASCSFTLGYTNSGMTTRYGFVAGGSFSGTSAPMTTCSSGTCVGIPIGYDLQQHLTVAGGFGLTYSTSSETNDGWYKYGDLLSVSSNGIGTRTAGSGPRVASWQVDSGPITSVATLGEVTTSTIAMTAAHSVTFASVTQSQVTLDAGASASLNSITPPTISGDSFWYDGGTLVTLSLNGVYGRSGGAGTRLASYSVNGGGSTSVSTTGTVTVLGAVSISGAEAIATTSVAQYQLTLSTSGAGTASATTNPSITGDVGWYDTGTAVVISATPNTGSSFASWSGSGTGSYTGTNDPTTVIMNAAISETAIFQLEQQGTLSLDGSVSTGTNLGATVTVSLTTSCSPDVVIVLIGENTARATATANTPTATGLTFTQRTSLPSGSIRVWEYYAITTGLLTSQSITEVMSQPTAYTMTAFAVCGANTASPFDSNPSLPKANGGLWGTSHSNTATTSSSNDFIFAFDSSEGNPSYTTVNGYTSLRTQQVSSWMASSSEYKVVSSIQSGTALGFTLSVGESGSQIVDAIVAASSSNSTSSSGAIHGPFWTSSTPSVIPSIRHLPNAVALRL